jgi:cytochrome c biogenesis protein CcmG/thiol:disulfide interchange protein DsbE
MNRLVVHAASLLVVVLCGSRVAADRATRVDGPPAPGVTAPAASFRNARNQIVSLAQQRGRVVLLNFWATWCTGCKTEIPWYIAFDKKYRRAGLTIIGVSMDDEGWPAVTPYLTAHPIRYPIVLTNGAATRDYDAMSLPLSMLIDRHGVVAASHVGVVDRDEWETKIVALLGER